MKADYTQMDGKPAEEQARQALKHMLERIREHPEIGYFCGYGTQTFALLTEAAATLFNEPVAQVREHFLPRNACDPYAERREG